MKAVAVLNTNSIIRRGGDLVMIQTTGIDLSRVRAGGCPLLDTHTLKNSPLGHVADAWVIDKGLLMASLVFDDNPAGRRAYAMIERGELRFVSPGLRSTDISIHDRKTGIGLDDKTALERQHDPNLIFVVRHSVLQEVSLATVPVSPETTVFACSESAVNRAMIQQGQEILRRILHPELPEFRQGVDDDAPLLRTIVPGRETILFGAAEEIINRW